MTNTVRFFPGKRFWFYWFPVIFCCAALFIQSHHAAPQTLPKLPYMDKFLHLFVYAILGALFYRALRCSFDRYSLWTFIWLSIVFTSLYGMSDEIHQTFVVSRSADILDWLADTIGGAAGVYGYYRITKSPDSKTSVSR